MTPSSDQTNRTVGYPQTGTLFLVVGPSGAGKDSVIRGARTRLEGNPDFVFPARAITRPPQAREGHRHLSERDFAAEEAGGHFALSWRAHGFAYGIGKAIEADLAAGRSVIVNVSRTVIDPAREKFAAVRVIALNAPDAVLAARLAKRGRETEAQAEARLARARTYAVQGPGVIELMNDGTLDEAVEMFLGIIGHSA